MLNRTLPFTVSAQRAFVLRSFFWVLAIGMGACVAADEGALRRDLWAARSALEHPLPGASAKANGSLSTGGQGTAVPSSEGERGPRFEEYLATALAGHPSVRAEFARWQASVSRISTARRLPEPIVSFGLFLRSVETRVGPQRARVSLQQAFPWPTKLSAGADSAAAQARAAQQRFEARVLRVAEEVAEAYWTLWQVRETRAIHQQHLEIMKGLSESVRARIVTGVATLAELQQVELTVARVQDGIYGMHEAEHRAVAGLRFAVGAQGSPAVLRTVGPEGFGRVVVPSESREQLVVYAQQHPVVREFSFKVDAKEALARSKAAEHFPSFMVGADWIVTSKAATPGVPQSGKDAIMVGAGIRVPLFQGTYDDAVQAARAEAGAHQQDRYAAELKATSKLDLALSSVRDSARRTELYQHTLLPLADSAYASVLGAYTAGRGAVAQLLLAQRDLLELNIERTSAIADHARSWAKLEYIVGRDLPRRRFEGVTDGRLVEVQGSTQSSMSSGAEVIDD